MTLLIMVFCIICCMFGKKVFHTIINPISAYAGSWLLCLVCNNILHYQYGAYTISDSIYFMVMCSISCVIVAICILSKSRYRVNNYTYNLSLNKNIFYLFNIFAIITVLPWTIESMQTMLYQGIYTARMEAVIGTGDLTFMLKDLYKNAVIQPVFISTAFTAIDSLVFDTSNEKGKLLLLALVDLTLITITFFGRWMLLKASIFLIIDLIVRLNGRWRKSVFEIKKINRMKKACYWIIGILIVTMILITSQRSYGAEGSILETVYLYFGGSLNYLDLGVNEIANSDHILFGWGLFPSIWDNFINLFQKLTGVDFLRPQEIVYLYNAPIKYIGGGMVFTGFGTVLMNMYLDGRWAGVIVDSFILGALATMFWQRMKRNSDNQSRIWYVYSIMIMLLVTIQWDGNSLSSMMCFVYIWLFYRPQRIYIKWR